MLQIFLMVHSHFHGVNLRHRPYFSFRPFRGRLGPPDAVIDGVYRPF